MKITGSQRHSFVFVETDKRQIIWVDKQGNITRRRTPEGVSFDVWAMPDGTVLYTHYGLGTDGVSVVDKQDRVLFRYETQGEVFGCQPLENGNILLGEVRGQCITEVNRQGKVVRKIPVEYTGANPHNAMRMVRRHRDTYFAVQPGSGEIALFEESGRLIRRVHTRMDTFGAVMRNNGNLLYTHRSGVVEVDPMGREVWELKAEEIPEMGVQWLLGIQLLESGNLVLTNWLGHDRHRMGIPFFEVTPEKRVVWTCDCTEAAEEAAVLQVLEENAERVCFIPLK